MNERYDFKLTINFYFKVILPENRFFYITLFLAKLKMILRIFKGTIFFVETLINWCVCSVLRKPLFFSVAKIQNKASSFVN